MKHTQITTVAGMDAISIKIPPSSATLLTQETHSGENGKDRALRLTNKPNGEGITKSYLNCKKQKYIWKWEYLKTLSTYAMKCKIKVKGNNKFLEFVF